MALARVLPIALEIKQIIGNINRGGAQTKCNKGQQQSETKFACNYLMRCQNWHEQQNVFDPLVHSKNGKPFGKTDGRLCNEVNYIHNRLRSAN